VVILFDGVALDLDLQKFAPASTEKKTAG